MFGMCNHLGMLEVCNYVHYDVQYNREDFSANLEKF